MVDFERVRQKIQNELGDGFSVTIRDVVKQNDITRKGFVISKDGSKVSSSIYIPDRFYEEDCDGEDELVHIVVSTYNYDAINKAGLVEKNIGFLSNKDDILARVVPALMSKDINRQYLDDVVYRNFVGDLVIVYKVLLDGIDASYTITDKLVDRLDINLNKLHDAALRNLAGHTFVKSMFRLLADMKGFSISDEEEEFLMKQQAMLVIGNDRGVNGASSIMSDDVLEEVHHKLDSDSVAILPSSRHEVIAVPYRKGVDIGALLDMVSYVNDSELDQNDKLSDNVFIHNIEKGWCVA